ncbi:hypothetical protein LCGC14_1515620, partial [marine sediment metagenome]
MPNAQLDIFSSNQDIFPWPYDRAIINIKKREYIIHVISPHLAGQRLAQTFMAKALEIWQPRFIILVGVAGSIRKASIGDIILPRIVWIYDLYKKHEDHEEAQPDA